MTAPAPDALVERLRELGNKWAMYPDQHHLIAIEAADRIESDAKTIATLTAERDSLRGVVDAADAIYRLSHRECDEWHAYATARAAIEAGKK